MEALRSLVEQRLRGEESSEIIKVFDAHKIITRVHNDILPSLSEAQNGNAPAECEVELIPEYKFGDALEDVQRQKLSKITVSEIFRRTATAYSVQGMTFHEFSLACKFPSKIEEWLATLELPRLLSKCIPSDKVLHEELEILQNLDEETLTAAMTVFTEQVVAFTIFSFCCEL
jgi:hypothetical protein